jgi:DNA polymerase family A
MDSLSPYREIWLADFEFCQPPGSQPSPLCLVAREYRTGQTLRMWADDLASEFSAPIGSGSDSLFVAYYASAELGCFQALGWPLPERILDLFCEFRCITNGLDTPCGAGLLGALAHFGIDGIDACDKAEMRELAIRGGIYTEAERKSLLAYCETDVLALAKLLAAMLPKIDLARALLRGRYMAAAARMEWNGVPIDTEALSSLRDNWTRIKGRLTREIDRDYGVFVSTGAHRLDPQSRLGAAIYRAAAESGIQPLHLAAAVDDVYERYHESLAPIIAAEVAARERTGLSVRRIERWEDAGRDHSTWPALDVTARELATEHPELGVGRGYVQEEVADDTDHAGLLWDRLREPTPRLLAKHDREIIDEAVALAAGAPNELPDEVELGFSAARWADWLIRNGIPWPRLASGNLALDDDTFRQMARTYPAVAPIRELRHALGDMRLFADLAVGPDGRNRCLLSAFRSLTGRNQPSNARFIFGPSCWLRGLIRPGPGRAIAYVDWSQQEFGIAAALSGDMAMQSAYTSGDPYLAFAKQVGAVPRDATKVTHGAQRELFKVCALAVQYGMGAKSLALSLDKPEAVARELLRLHRQTYPKFWAWSESAVDHAMLRGCLHTVFGWRVQVGPRANPRSLANFPMQANGAEMLRLACCLATERGIVVCAPVHDALLIEADDNEIEATIAATQVVMAEASRTVLGGFALRSDAKVVRFPDRYMDPRGQRMWETVASLLANLRSVTPEESEIAF